MISNRGGETPPPLDARDAPSLLDFLRARYDEREQKARAAAADYTGDSGLRWRIDCEDNIRPADPMDNSVVAVGGWGGGVDEATGLHIVDNDPQHVLDDLNSKRAILGLHHDDGHGDCAGCGLDPTGLAMHGIDECPTLLALARPFAAHPDYRDRWKP